MVTIIGIVHIAIITVPIIEKGKGVRSPGLRGEIRKTLYGGQRMGSSHTDSKITTMVRGTPTFT